MIQVIQTNLEILGFKEKEYLQEGGMVYEKHNLRVTLFGQQAKIEVTMANNKKLFGTWTYEGSFLQNLVTLNNTLLIRG